jgi:hypothetical protein
MAIAGGLHNNGIKPDPQRRGSYQQSYGQAGMPGVRSLSYWEYGNEQNRMAEMGDI